MQQVKLYHKEFQGYSARVDSNPFYILSTCEARKKHMASL